MLILGANSQKLIPKFSTEAEESGCSVTPPKAPVVELGLTMFAGHQLWWL